ncbi:recombinase RecT [Comamonas sp. NyZ500]|uniref:recombinase RecT n=1 Tax=Comamonas sp. NyZ500 TaxID=2795732 RepID=UPI00192CCAEB|nr:recombinase RecT [Comamonas sp. NyZ500]MBL5978395.1 recombinase RecT [Comamonas sp. NyZ500]
MSNALTAQQSTALRPAGQFDLSPQTFDQALTFSQYLADSDLVPKDFKGKPGNCLIAMQWGSELGLKPLQSLQNLAVINGRPALWGDAVIALVMASPVCEYVTEDDDGETAFCRVKRKGAPEQVRSFSMDDARKAGLAGKQGPWTQYPKRMRQMRARAFALRDVFPDVLRGMPIAEELQDMSTATPAASQGERHMGQAEVVQPEWPADRWAAGLQKWVDGIAAGKPLADVLAWLNSKAKVTAEQEQQLRDEVAKRQQAADTSTTAPDPEKLASEIKACTDLNKLYDLGNQIETIADPSQQATLTDIFDARAAELEQA